MLLATAQVQYMYHCHSTNGKKISKKLEKVLIKEQRGLASTFLPNIRDVLGAPGSGSVIIFMGQIFSLSNLDLLLFVRIRIRHWILPSTSENQEKPLISTPF
jgi:hypothetical protein